MISEQSNTPHISKELEKLREANHLAQLLLSDRTSSATNNVKQEKRHPYDEIAISQYHEVRDLSRMNSECVENDLWGACRYLEHEDNKITYAKSYLKHAEEILRRNKKLLKVCEISSYDTVNDVESLSTHEKDFDRSFAISSGTSEFLTDMAKSEDLPNPAISKWANFIDDFTTPDQKLSVKQLIPSATVAQDIRQNKFEEEIPKFITKPHTNQKEENETILESILMQVDEDCSHSDSTCVKEVSKIYTDDQILRKHDAEFCEAIGQNKSTDCETYFHKIGTCLKMDCSQNRTFTETNSQMDSVASPALCNWDLLPNEMVVLIFSYLGNVDLNQLSLVNHRFREITKDSVLRQNIEACDKELNCEWFESFMTVKPRFVNLHRCSATGLRSKSLRNFFQNCKTSLRKLFVSESKHETLFGDNILLHASSHCKRLESIYVPWTNLTDNGISALAYSHLILKDVDISGNWFITDESFIKLMQETGHSIQTLKINGCFALSCEGFLSVAENCQNLLFLDMGLCSKVTSECILNIFPTMTKLRELDLRGLKAVNDECLLCISGNCKSLSKLVIANCLLITDAGVMALSLNLPKMMELDISGCKKVSDVAGCELAINLNSPISLNLSSTSISCGTVLKLTDESFFSLQILKLSFCCNITQYCIQRLIQHCYNLKCLHIHGCKRIMIKELKLYNASLNIVS